MFRKMEISTKLDEEKNDKLIQVSYSQIYLKPNSIKKCIKGFTALLEQLYSDYGREVGSDYNWKMPDQRDESIYNNPQLVEQAINEGKILGINLFWETDKFKIIHGFMSNASFGMPGGLFSASFFPIENSVSLFTNYN